ncbi:unnamed protein product [Thlaspi arvense]|uniref:Uncharacterized protein n=1 Tax=Thlaspi arvense TaxID=13288 RepID=A0AAU9S7B7_THLAR|nr:unnamed protein product [Thlaspi arvense]
MQAMNDLQGTKKISSCVGIDNDSKLKRHNLEAEKRLKRMEQDYLHANQKFTETRSQWESLYDEKIRAINLCNSASNFINSCNQLVEKLQSTLDKIPTTEKATDHSLQDSLFNSGKTLARENMMILQQKAQCQKLEHEAIREFREINRELKPSRFIVYSHVLLNFLSYQLHYNRRSDSRKAVNDLLKEVRDKNKCIDKALSNCTLVCKPTSHDTLTTSVKQKAQCQKLEHEAIREFREINRELHYIQRKMPRSDSRKAVNDLLKEVKEKNKCRDKALSICTLVCTPTSHDTLRTSVELEIKVLKKLIRELQKDWEEKLQIKQYATNIHKTFRQKARHLQKKKEHLSGQWDEERKNMLRVMMEHDRIGTYPEATYIMYVKMSNDN